VKKSQNTKLRIAINLIKILRDGPEVSFNGSPTVSPITAALCSSDPFFLVTLLMTNYPDSIYFLALSHAPPELLIEIAIYTPLTNAPGNNPAIILGPNNRPNIKGVKITNAPGPTIIYNEAYVEIAIHLL